MQEQNINNPETKVVISSCPPEEVANFPQPSQRDFEDSGPDLNFTFTLTARNSLSWGFDLLIILPDPNSAYPLQLLLVRRGPYAGSCLVISGQGGKSLKHFPIMQTTLGEFEELERLVIHKRDQHPIWQHHPELWLVRSTLWMMHVCRSVEDDPYIPSPYQIAARHIISNPSSANERLALAHELRVHAHALNEIVVGKIEPYSDNITRPSIHNPGKTTDEEIANAVETIDGVFWMDELAASYFEKLPGGADMAKDLREASRTRVAAYLNDQNRDSATDLLRFFIARHHQEPTTLFIMRLGEVLYDGTIKPRLKRKAEIEARRRRNPPALALSIAPAVAKYSGWHKGTKVISSDDGDLHVIDSRDFNKSIIALAPALEVKHMKNLFGRSLADDYPALATPLGQELTAWATREVWRRTMDGEPSPTQLEIEGGFRGLLERIGFKGVNGGTESKTLASALLAGKTFHIYWPGIEEVAGLWTYHNKEARRGQPALLRIGVSPFLAPNYKAGERLVPIVETPPLVGRRNDHAAQLAFKFELVLEMVKAGEAILDGGAYLPEPELERLASLVGLPASTMNKALDRWTQDGEDGPSMLERHDDRFLLANNDPYRDAREFILEGARRVREGRANGLRSASTREHARRTRRPKK